MRSLSYAVFTSSDRAKPRPSSSKNGNWQPRLSRDKEQGHIHIESMTKKRMIAIEQAEGQTIDVKQAHETAFPRRTSVIVRPDMRQRRSFHGGQYLLLRLKHQMKKVQQM